MSMEGNGLVVAPFRGRMAVLAAGAGIYREVGGEDCSSWCRQGAG